MAKSGINKVILVGNLGNDPETRHTPNGGAVTTLSVATSESWNDKETGQKQERTEWHRVVVFGKLAEIVGEYARKGRKVYVEGSLRTRKWQDQSGQDRYTTEIVADEVMFIDSNRGESHGDQGGQQAQYNEPAAPVQQQRQAQPQRQPAQGNPQQRQQGGYNNQGNRGYVGGGNNNANNRRPAPAATADMYGEDVPF